MKTYKESEKSTIVAFHVGRGGRFNNAGHLSFIGCKKISEFVDDLFLTDIEIADGENDKGVPNYRNIPKNEQHYTDCSGNSVGLSLNDCESGIGRIEQDGAYDTTYTKLLEDCNESEIELIGNHYLYSDLIEEL